MTRGAAVIFSLLALPTHIFAQEGLSFLRNCPRDSDVINVWERAYFPPGDSGEGAVWTFDASEDGWRATETYRHGPAGEILRTADGHRATFCLRDSILVEVTDESPTYSVAYDIPKLHSAYPLSFGDRLTRPFSGQGVYCKKAYFTVSGNVTKEADASGCLLLPDGTTFRNVLRVHTLTTSVIKMSADTLSLPQARETRETRHLHEWYLPGFRYPVCGTETRTTYDGGVAVAESRRSFTCLPDSQALSPDPANEALLLRGKGGAATSGDSQDIISYQVRDDGSGIIVEYSLDIPAEVSFTLCDAYGTVYRSQSSREEAGEGYTLTIDHSSLHRGSYVLYITAGGLIHGEKFTKR